MINNNSNKILWITFAVLLTAVIIIFTTDSTKKERSFRKELVAVDTASITNISLFPKSIHGKEVKIFKENSIWKAETNNGKSFVVPKTKIKNLLSAIVNIKPQRIAARNKNKWSEYEIDSSSTRIVVKEGNSKVLDLQIGKFAFQQPRSMTTFVKLTDDNDVYEVDGFLNVTFNKDVDSFRDETVIKSDKNNWSKLNFTSNNMNNNYSLVKLDNKWSINGAILDSAKTDNALNSLSRLTNSNFVNIEKNELPPQFAKLIIESTTDEPVEIVAFKDSTNYIIHSSINPENYFDGNKIGNKIFLDKNSFFK